jgi:predicted O-methyltransferase YrrM
MDDGQEYVEGADNYIWFYLIGKLVRPRIIAEMGTRFGYSLKMFVDGAGHPPAEYQIRVFDEERDGFKPLDTCLAYFRTVIGVQDIQATRSDTRSLTSLNLPAPADLCMVDADHTTAGCLHECSLALASVRPGGMIVVDDILNPDVKVGADEFCCRNGLTAHYLPSLRGIYLIPVSRGSHA